MTDLLILDAAGDLSTTELKPAPGHSRPIAPLRSRVAYAATQVIRHAGDDDDADGVDWDATLAFRRHVWSWGLGVADAMDTAQRIVDVASSRELITRSAEAARESRGALVVGVGTGHVADELHSLDEVIAAYKAQLHFAEDAGAGVVLLASRQLVRAAQSADDYVRVYSEVLAAAGSPVLLQWLGAEVEPSLAGYFGHADPKTASATVLEIVTENVDRVSGITMNLLDPFAEIAVRAQLPETAAMFTGDEFNYTGLIAGSGGSGAKKHSDALLGAFAAMAPSASAAIQALDAGDSGEYESILGPTEDLARKIFAAPASGDGTGMEFMSWLNGHQDSFATSAEQHSPATLSRLSEIVRLANRSGALESPELAASRWRRLLGSNGIGR